MGNLEWHALFLLVCGAISLLFFVFSVDQFVRHMPSGLQGITYLASAVLYLGCAGASVIQVNSLVAKLTVMIAAMVSSLVLAGISRTPAGNRMVVASSFCLVLFSFARWGYV